MNEDEPTRIGRPPEPPPDVNLADLHDPQPPRGRHRSADTEPSTGPLYRLPIGPRGRHQEHDLEPKRWPWALGTTVLVVLAALAAFTWGHSPVGDLEAELATRPDRPVATETVTEPAPEPQKAPQPTVTVTETQRAGKAPKAAPTATETRWRTAPASPPATIYRDRLVPGPTVTKPGPTVYRTREVQVRVETCYRVNRAGEYLGVIECP